MRFWPGCGCCGPPCNPATTRVCANLLSSCGGYVVPGKVVTVRDPDGNVVGTCTTAGVITGLTQLSGGAGYTPGTGYALGFSGTGAGASGTFDVGAGGHVTNLILTAGGTGWDAAPTITFPGAGAGTGASARASVVARCCVGTTVAGVHTVSAAGDCNTPSTTANVVCGSTTTVNLTATGATVTLSVSSDCEAAPNVGFRITGNGVDFGMSVSGGTGTMCLPVFGTYTLTLTGNPCYQDKTQSLSVTSCTQTIGVSLLAKTYSYSGTVTGACQGGPLAGATVTIAGTAGGGVATTDAGGNFTIGGLKALCTFDLSVSMDCYATYSATGLTMGCSDNIPGVIALGPDGTHMCFCGCETPVPTGTYVIEDSVGGHALHWDPFAPFTPGAAGHTDCITWQSPIDVSCQNLGGFCCYGTENRNVAYSYAIGCSLVAGVWTITMSRIMVACNVPTNPPDCNIPTDTADIANWRPVASECNAFVSGGIAESGNGAACGPGHIGEAFSGGLFIAESHSVGVPDYCPACGGVLSISFNFTFGFSDTATYTRVGP